MTPEQTSRHTPGPWHVYHMGGAYLIHPHDKLPHLDATAKAFTAADATLIAAAPDLLAAAESVNQPARHGPMCDYDNETGEDGPICVCWMGQLRAAIAKARGEAQS